MMFRLNVPTKRGSILNGVLFRQEEKQVLYKKGQIVQSERVDIIFILHSFHNHSNSNMSRRISILIQYLTEQKKSALLSSYGTVHLSCSGTSHCTSPLFSYLANISAYAFGRSSFASNIPFLSGTSSTVCPRAFSGSGKRGFVLPET